MHPSFFLPRELLALVFQHLVELYAMPDGQNEGQQEAPLLSAAGSAAVAAAACAHTWWRAACLAEVRWCHALLEVHSCPNAMPPCSHMHSCSYSIRHPQVRCRIRLGSPADALRLAAAPGLPCTELQLPPPPAAAHRSDPAEWCNQQRLVAAVEQLLCSPAFRRRSGATLRCIRNVPLAAAERGALAGGSFP